MSRYSAAHVNPEGPGDARPTALQIIKDEGVEGQLVGKVIVITGTSSGIGIETARALATTGATLFLLARDVPKAKVALGDIVELDQVELVQINLNSFESVRTAAKTILGKTDKVNILINNAGIMAIPELRFTNDGHELQFGTNHLSHFLLFQLLKSALLAAVTPEFASRVINVSSAGHRLTGISESGNYNFQNGGYSGWVSYAQSKTANIYMANEIDRRYGFRGLHATSLNPGIIFTNLTRHMSKEELEASSANKDLFRIVKSSEQGAATTVMAAVGKEWENKGGRYLANCVEATQGEDDGDILAITSVSHTYNAENESRLWKDSIRLVGLNDDESW